MRLIDRGRAFLARVAQSSAAVVTLLYTDLSGNTCDLSGSAWEGRTAFASNTQSGARLEWGDRDYLVPVEDLVINGAQAQPVEGGRFTQTINGQSVTFEIQAPGNEPPWRYADPQRTIYRCHTKQV